MAEIVVSVVAKVAELVVVPVGKHICYPFKYKTNMDELKKQVEKLTAARDRVQHSIEEAERQRLGIESDVKNWLNSVDEFTEGVVKNIIGGDDDEDDEDEENKAKKLCAIGFCPNPMMRYSLSKKAEKTAKVGVDLLKEGKFEKVSYCPAIQRASSIYIRGYNDFDSRTTIFQDIMQTLADDNVNIIGVHGMGGVGKTTLVKRVVGKAIDDKLFDVVVMADVTQTPDIQKIQAQIADGLDLKFEVESLSGRAARLRDRLKKEKRVLLVLDDLWKKLDLQDVGIPFGEGGNAEQRQCKLLLTSRDLHLLRDHMNTQKNFQLKILTDEEAGNLFWQTVGDSTKTSDFDTIGVEIIRRCAGLPVAIATIASALKNKSRFVWKDALDQLKKSNPRHIEGVEKEVYSVIKWSYDFLQNEEEKSVFLLCSLYNASFNIDIDYLLQYCIGLGVFQGVSTIEQARNRLHKIIDKLKASHLLLDGNAPHLLLGGNTNMCVKMHDIVHAVAFSIASTDKLMFNIQDVTDLKERLEEKLLKNSIAMSLPFKDVSELPERLECSELKLLVLLKKDTSLQIHVPFYEGMERLSLQIPDPFFEGMEGLKVLHLNNIHMLSLPSSLCRLTSLQTLHLNRCLLGDIVVIGALKRIEILSFLSSTIEQLPRDLSQLTRLRLLDLRYCSKLKVISPNLISSLTRLEELYIGNSFVGWDVEGRSNASLVELKQLSHLERLDICVLDARIIPQDLLIFEKLESYRINIGDVWNRFGPSGYQWMQKLKLNNLDNYFESSRMLKLKLNDSNIYLGNDFRLLLNRAEDLHLDELKGAKNVVCQLDGEGFPQLKHLYVRNDPEIQYIISAIGRDLCNVFPKLELLFLDKLVNLKKICHGQLPPESFNKLRIMKVTGCDTLNHLFSFSMVKNLSQLQEIEVTNCKKLEVIIFKESEEQVHQNDRISGVEFTQLRTLTLRGLPRLTSFVFHSLTPNTESQEIVSADQPRGFMSLFSQNVAFPCLKELTLERLPKLLHLWKEDSQPRIFFENLTNLNVSYCENLKTLVPFSVPLEKLTNLTVQSCNRLMNLMTLSTAKTLVELKTINIQQCKMLEEIITVVGDEEIRTAEAEKDVAIDKITWSMLNSVTLDHLPNLITFHSGINTMDCPTLTNIYIKYCPKMEAFVFPDTKDPSIRSASLFNEKVVLPISASLHLHGISIQRMQAMSSCPTNLTRLNIVGCHNFKYLFPSSMAESLVHIGVLHISNCKLMEVVIITQEERKSSTLFPKLKKLILEDLPELRTFGCFTGNLIKLPSLNELDIKNCPTVQTFACDSLCADMLAIEEESEEVSTEKEENLPSFFDEKVALPCLKLLELQKLPKLLYLWKEDSQPRIVFENLTSLNVSYCENLKTLVPFSVPLEKLTTLTVQSCNGLMNLITLSTAKTLVELKKINIQQCKMLEEIITDVGDEEIRTAEAEKDAAIDKITLSMLNSVTLDRLPNLITFHSRSNTLECPSLIDIYIKDCPKMEASVFLEKVVLPISASLHLRGISIQRMQAMSSCPTNLTRLNIVGCHNFKYLFPSSMAESLVRIGVLRISNCKLMEVVIITQEERKSSTLFPKLKKLILEDLPELRTFCCFTGNLIKLPSLNELDIKNCPTVQTFACDSLCADMLAIEEESEEVSTEKEENLPSFFDEKVALPCLKLLELQKLPKLLYLWKEDSQPRIVFENLTSLNVSYCENLKTLVPFSVPLDKLTTLTVQSCNGLMNLITLSTAKTLVELKKINIQQCKMLEEIITDVGDEEIRTAEAEKDAAIDKITLSMLNSVTLDRLPNLITFHSRSNTLECPSLTDIYITDCPKMEAFVFLDTKDPSIRSASLCNEKVVLPIRVSLHRHGISIQHLKAMSSCPTNLTWLTIVGCHNFKYLFPSSMAESLVHLGVLHISNCKLMEVVIITQEERKSSTLFPKLNLLILKDLPELRTFCCFTGNLIKPPSLNKLHIKNCPTVQTFASDSLCADMLAIEEESEEVSTEKEENLRSFFDEKVALPCLKLLELQKLPKFYLWKEDSQPRIVFENLTNINVSYCENLKTLVPFSVPLEKLTTLTVQSCHGLMNLITLSTAKTLVQLKEVTIEDCNMLEEIITDVGDEEIRTAEAEKDAAIDKITLSMLNSITLDRLPNLITFHSGSNTLECPSLTNIYIKYCPKMEAFVFPDTKDPSIRSGSHFSEKVVLPISASLYPCGISVQHLQAMSSCLTNLTKLTTEGFDNLKYLFSSSMAESLVHLGFLHISNCKLMEVVIITQEERKSSTLFPKLKKLILEDLPELRTFCCFTGNLIKLPSLNELDIKNCPTVQTFACNSLCADMLAIEEESEEVSTEKEENLPSFFDEKVALPCLKRLLLRKLPGLLHLWKENSQPSKVFKNLSLLKVVGCGNLTTLLSSSVSLQNLRNLDVRKCDGLINLVPFSTAQSLKQLEIMITKDCKMIEEIIIDMGDEVKDKIVFDQLITLGLHGLPSLTSFCKGNFTIEFPSLSRVFVIKCLKMMSFSQGALSTPKLRRLKLKEEVDGVHQDSDDDDEWFSESEWDEDSEEGEEDAWNWEGDLNTSIQQFFEDGMYIR